MQAVDVDLAQTLAWSVMESDTPVVVADAVGDFPITFVNPAFEAMTGYRAQEVLGRNCRFLQGSETDPAVARTMSARLHAGQFVRARLINYRADGTRYWSDLHISSVRDATGAVARYIAILHDVTEEVADLERVTQAATLDALTRLVNRVTFAAETERELLRATRHGRSAAVLFLDLDRFKQVNDTHGHTVGDGHLQRVADTLRQRLRREDMSARHGGDEFTVLLTDLPADPAAAADAVASVVAHLDDALGEPFVIGGTEHGVTVTIGTALFPHHARTVPELIDYADGDMYQRKRQRGTAQS